MQIHANSKEPLIKRPFDLEEAIVLLDVYLSLAKNGIPFVKAAEIASARLRSLAKNNEYIIADSYRSSIGVADRLRILGAIYEGRESPSKPGTRVFMDAVSIYKQNKAQFDEILNMAQNKITQCNDGDKLLNTLDEKQASDMPETTQEASQCEKMKYDFTNAQRFTHTVPVNCSIAGSNIEAKTWAQLLVNITERELVNQNPAMTELYNRSLLSSKQDRPYMTKEKIDGLTCAKFSNGYWICTNYSIPQLIHRIRALCLKCGYSLEQIILYGESKTYHSMQKRNSAPVGADYDSSRSGIAIHTPRTEEIPHSLRNAIKVNYAAGMRFDNTVLSLLSHQSGLEITDSMCSVLRKEMFKRSDDLFFLPEQIADKKELKAIKEETRNFLETYKLCEVSKLYEIKSMDTSISCIRNEDDYANLLEFLLPDFIRVVKTYTYKTVRPAGTSVNEAAAYLSGKILTDIVNSGCVTEEALLTAYPIISGQFLKKLLEKNTDEVTTTTINDFLCYQTIASMGLDENFPDMLNRALEKANELELPPSIEVLHTLLSMEIGQNFRNAYAIPDNKTFRRIIAMNYRGEKKREWRAGNFLEVHRGNV